LYTNGCPLIDARSADYIYEPIRQGIWGLDWPQNPSKFCFSSAKLSRKNFVNLMGLPTFYLDSWNYFRENKYRKDKFYISNTFCCLRHRLNYCLQRYLNHSRNTKSRQPQKFRRIPAKLLQKKKKQNLLEFWGLDRNIFFVKTIKWKF